MFDEQNKNTGVEDILAATEAPVASPGPPSALAGGKLQPVQNNPMAVAVPLEQMSSVGHSSFPVKKIIALVIVVLVIGGGATAGYFWWQGRGQSGLPADLPLAAPGAPDAPITTTPPPPAGGPLNQALDQFQENSINSALDPFSSPPGGSNSNPSPAAAPAPSADTDQDGLTDADEATNGTNPRLVDSDGDGLSDWEEVTVFGTNALNSDTDSDTFTDGSEVQNGYNPNGPGKLLDFDKAKTQAQ
ncbi:MAG: hypothetical protein AAB880_00290 [Patescibacteria group bacterium]